MAFFWNLPQLETNPSAKSHPERLAWEHMLKIESGNHVSFCLQENLDF
jgi:hypothetical protein